MDILTIVGARPQFVKAEPLGRALKEAGHRQRLVHTGQHWDRSMSDLFFKELNILEPEVNLGVGSGSHGWQTGQMLSGLEQILLAQKPDWVMVLGDTNSTLAGALAAVKLHIPLAHVEAGLRSFNRRMPEEINRVLTDHAADLLFAPTEFAVKNLIQEGISLSRVICVGDVMQDAFLHFAGQADRKSTVLKDLRLSPRSYILATIHRAENTEDSSRLRAIFEGLQRLVALMPVVLPLHPRTRCALQREQMLKSVEKSLRLIGPVGYLDMLALERNAAVIASDSGGVQKEAYFCRVPCVTLRDETEWTELVELGWNRLCPPRSAEDVAGAICASCGEKGQDMELYGGGNAARRIADCFSAARSGGTGLPVTPNRNTGMEPSPIPAHLNGC